MQRLKNYSYETRQFKKRLLKATIVVIILLILLIVRLFNLQILNYRFYSDLALHNQLDHLPIEPNRGLIYDRNGILLAENLPIFSLNVVAERVKNLKSSLDDLKTIIAITPNDLQQYQKSRQKYRGFEQIPLKLKLTEEEVAAFYVNQYRFPGVTIDAKMIRHYPLAGDMVSFLGYVGRINKQDQKNIDATNYSDSDFIGKVGIEKYYENKLRGKIGYKIAEVDASGHVVRIVKIVPPIPGESLYLTIDSKLQKVAQDALQGESGAIVAVDPNSGEILALVSNPTYDPNLFAIGIDSATFNQLQSSSSKPMYNRAVKSSQPFGSTIKPFIALQGLETKTINQDFKIFDPGWFKLEHSTHTYRDWVHNGHGAVNVSKAIIESCSTFFYAISVKLGIEKIVDILERFGFGSKTGIDLTEESSGVVASPQWVTKHVGRRWYTGDTIISGIGQGYMSATPLQLAHGVATIAMRGKRYQPHLLLATKVADEAAKVNSTPVALKPVTLQHENHWNIIIDAMQGVVTDPQGTAYNRFGSNPAYSVAGKTGTAQLYHHKIVNENPTPQSEENTSKHLRNHSLFIVFAPVENPKIALAIVVENNHIAPQVARKVLDYYLQP